MFAVIMQSEYVTHWGEKMVRQTAIVPMTADNSGNARAPRVFHRTNATRGVSGAWSETQPVFDANEVLLDNVKAIKLTAGNLQMLEFPITPQTVMQRLLRELSTDHVATAVSASDVYASLVETAVTNPASLVVYTMDTPVVPVAVQPAPVVTPVDVQPEPTAPLADDVAPLEVVVEHYEPAISHTPNTESEDLVEHTMAYQATTQVTETASVLTVPDVQPYFPRVHFGKTEDEVLSYAQRTQQAVLFTGPAGTGKTSAARHYAATHQLPFEVVECTQQIDQSVTQGRFVATADGGVRWLDSRLATALQQPSVVLFNELTRMSPKAASLFLRILQERELSIEPLNKVVKVHPECLIVADQNTGFGYTGTSKQDAALLDRFNIKLEFKYDSDIESKFIKSPALLAFADGVRVSAEANDEFSTPMSTRLLINFQSQAQNLGFEFAVNSLLNNFPKTDGEREAIKMRIDADAYTIASELGVEYQEYNAN